MHYRFDALENISAASNVFTTVAGIAAVAALSTESLWGFSRPERSSPPASAGPACVVVVMFPATWLLGGRVGICRADPKILRFYRVGCSVR